MARALADSRSFEPYGSLTPTLCVRDSVRVANKLAPEARIQRSEAPKPAAPRPAQIAPAPWHVGGVSLILHSQFQPSRSGPRTITHRAPKGGISSRVPRVEGYTFDGSRPGLLLAWAWRWGCSLGRSPRTWLNAGTAGFGWRMSRVRVAARAVSESACDSETCKAF